MRVLLVESDNATAEIVADVLASAGHVVVRAATAAQARAAVANGAWDACLADGFGAVGVVVDPADSALFSALARTAPVIVASGRAWARHADAAALGVAALLGKPYDVDVLLAELDRLTAPGGRLSATA